MTTKRQKGNEGLTMGDALKQTGAVDDGERLAGKIQPADGNSSSFG